MNPSNPTSVSSVPSVVKSESIFAQLPSINHQRSTINSKVGRRVPAEPSGSDSPSSALSVPSVVKSESIRAQLPVSATPDASDSDLLHIRVSDETIDRYREVISASGWKLDNYQRNPVIQNAHQYGDIIFTIGRAEKTWVNDDTLLQTWRFASTINPFAKIARDLYRGGFLNAASVGFIPLKWEDAPQGSPGAAGSGLSRRYLEQELLEVSAVGIPANPNALTLAYAQGAIAKSDLRELHDLITSMLRSPQRHEGDSLRSPRREEGDSSLVVPPSGGPQSGNPSVLNLSSLLPLARELRSLSALLKS